MLAQRKSPRFAGLDCVCAALGRRGVLVEQLADALGRDGEPIVLGGGAHDALVLFDSWVVLVCHGGAKKEPRVARKEKEGGQRRPGAA